MKKIQNQVKKNRTILILSSVLTASAVFLPGCDLFAYKQPFPDAYYDNNFIEAIGFDVFEGDNSTIPAAGSDPVTGKWDFAYRYQNWDGFGYMKLNRTSAAEGDPGSTAADFGTVPVGIASTAPVYRLELVNLISGGDFETDETAQWTVTGTATFQWNNSAFFFADGSMKLDSEKASSLRYTPRLIPGVPSFDDQNTYKAFFRYKTTEQLSIKVDDATELMTMSGINSASFPSFAGSGSTPFFRFSPYITTATFSNLFVDNFRISRMGNMELRLLLTPTQTDPFLESGVYSFSVWVRSDPAAFTDPDPDSMIKTAQEPYGINSFQVTMRAVSPAELTADSDSYVPGSDWTKMTATLKPRALKFSAGINPVIELVLDFNQSYAGRILLTQPELNFNPDGL